ncbi:MAG: type II toxin-antitoxin system YoeB family toxin [Chlorobiaceae bacterium]|nr:type II toxin-antitoxin system YoeB family toxin [Chlorobiaceae bacterium]
MKKILLKVGSERSKIHGSYGKSRRLNKKDRIIYSIDDAVVVVYILSLRGHYGDT